MLFVPFVVNYFPWLKCCPKRSSAAPSTAHGNVLPARCQVLTPIPPPILRNRTLLRKWAMGAGLGVIAGPDNTRRAKSRNDGRVLTSNGLRARIGVGPGVLIPPNRRAKRISTEQAGGISPSYSATAPKRMLLETGTETWHRLNGDTLAPERGLMIYENGRPLQRCSCFLYFSPKRSFDEPLYNSSSGREVRRMMRLPL